MKKKLSRRRFLGMSALGSASILGVSTINLLTGCSSEEALENVSSKDKLAK